MRIPTLVQIETTTNCNSHCEFCPHSGPGMFMEDTLISKIIDEIALWDREIDICPFLNGEPFIDPRMPAILTNIQTKIPKASIIIFTNGSLLKNAINTLSVPIKKMYISLHESDADRYHKRIGLNFNKTIENIKAFIEWNGAAKFVKDIAILRVQSGNTQEDTEFNDFVINNFGAYASVHISPPFNYAGKIDSFMQSDPNKICPRHGGICISVTGKVSLCCMDAKCEYPLGDINTNTILEVFNNELSIRYATTHKKLLTPCSVCNM
jgi:MoaA/NifB/PqqE/SkfB family radical SAM enzyme